MKAETLRRRLAGFSAREAGDGVHPCRSLGASGPLAAVAAPATSDDVLDLIDSDLTPASVLVALIEGVAPGVLLTKRTSHLSAHPGQVAFPGGRIDETDASPEDAALREAEEEIGLDPAADRGIA